MQHPTHTSGEPYELLALKWPEGDGEVQQIAPEEAVAHHPRSGLVWLRIVLHDAAATKAFLIEKVGMSEDWAEHAVSSRERPRLHEDGTSALLVTHAARLMKQKVYFDRISFYVHGHVLVSVEFKKTALIDQWFARCDDRGLQLGDNPGQILTNLLDAIVDDYFPILDELGHQLDRLENEVISKDTVDNKSILRLKRRLLETRRHVAPTRDVLNGLLRRDMLHITTDARSDLQDVYDHALRILEQLDLDLDLLSTLLDTHLAVISNRLGFTTQLLTVFATVLMSVSLVAGIYGMNFKHMPELDSPWGYPFAIGLMLVITALELWYFRKKKWF